MDAERQEEGPEAMFDIVSNETAEGGSQVITVDLRALRDHPAEIAEALDLRFPFTLAWTARRGEHVKQGLVDPEDPTFAMRFEKNDDPDGVWEVALCARSGKKEREIWRQDVFVQKDLDRTPERIHEIARRFAPILLLSDREEHFPVSLGDLLGDRSLATSEQTVKVKTVLGKREIPVGRLGEFMLKNGHQDYLLDFSFSDMKDSVFAGIGKDRTRSTVYYSYLEDPARQRHFINYHTFYAFDDKAGLARLTGIGPHVFDRESMVLVFEGEGDPVSVVISGHLEHQTIFYLERLKVWSQGRIRVRFDDPRTLRVGDHPVVAVAEGSHAMYPTSGEYSVSLLREAAGYFYRLVTGLSKDAGRDTVPGITAEQILVPPNMSGHGFVPYRLLPLRFDRLSSRLGPQDDEAGSSYLTFSGYWVDVPGSRNARFPPFTRKERDIDDWVDGAYVWEWDDLPEGVHENNALILDFIAGRLGGDRRS